MYNAAARLLVLLLVLAQVVVARAGGAGDVLCLGHAAPATQELASSCCHHHDHGAPIVPADPHEHDCPCIDIPVAIGIARPDPARDTDDAALAAAILLEAVPPSLTPAPIGLPRPPTTEWPPGPPPGLRTTRLLI